MADLRRSGFYEKAAGRAEVVAAGVAVFALVIVAATIIDAHTPCETESAGDCLDKSKGGGYLTILVALVGLPLSATLVSVGLPRRWPTPGVNFGFRVLAYFSLFGSGLVLGAVALFSGSVLIAGLSDGDLDGTLGVAPLLVFTLACGAIAVCWLVGGMRLVTTSASRTRRPQSE